MSEVCGEHRFDAEDYYGCPYCEIERLREAVGLLTTLYPAMEIDVNDPVGMAKEIEQYVSRKDQRIEELEEELCFPLRERAERRQGHIITTDQIRAAWEVAQYIHRISNVEWIANIVFKALAKLNIVRCEGCGGSGTRGCDSLSVPWKCPDCKGEGVKIGGGDE